MRAVLLLLVLGLLAGCSSGGMQVLTITGLRIAQDVDPTLDGYSCLGTGILTPLDGGRIVDDGGLLSRSPVSFWFHAGRVESVFVRAQAGGLYRLDTSLRCDGLDQVWSSSHDFRVPAGAISFRVTILWGWPPKLVY